MSEDNGVLSRRDFLRRSASAAAVLSAGGSVLVACVRAAVEERVRPVYPATLPPNDVRPIEPDRPIERGATLRIYQWREYLYDDVLQSFARRHRADDVGYRVESFSTIAEAISRLRGQDGDFDVFFPTIEALPRLAAEGLLAPLTHDLLPNLGNLWPFFREPGGPFYDVGQRYSLPYTVYSTGVGWRSDLVRPADAPDHLDDPLDAFWNPRYRVGLYDDYREGIALALLHRGGDVNATDPEAIRQAVDDLVAMRKGGNVRISVEGAYDDLPAGTTQIQQAWSGDVLAAKRFGHSNRRQLDRVEYSWPSGGVVGCDLMAVCARGRHPALAHAFLDHLLDMEVAMVNFTWNGYQPPVTCATPEMFASTDRWNGLVPRHLRTAILAPEDLDAAAFLHPLGPVADARWRAGWQRFLAA